MLLSFGVVDNYLLVEGEGGGGVSENNVRKIALILVDIGRRAMIIFNWFIIKLPGKNYFKTL